MCSSCCRDNIVIRKVEESKIVIIQFKVFLFTTHTLKYLLKVYKPLYVKATGQYETILYEVAAKYFRLSDKVSTL